MFPSEPVDSVTWEVEGILALTSRGCVMVKLASAVSCLSQYCTHSKHLERLFIIITFIILTGQYKGQDSKSNL